MFFLSLFNLEKAGYETLSTFLRWCMVYMILHPEIQQKVQAEIDRVIGRARLPSVADKSKMPYTDAVTIEIHRRSAFVPFGIAHCSTEDADFEGYTIPKGQKKGDYFDRSYSNQKWSPKIKQFWCNL